MWYPPLGEELHGDKVDYLLPVSRTYRILSETPGGSRQPCKSLLTSDIELASSAILLRILRRLKGAILSGFIHVRPGWRRDSVVHCNPDVAGDLRYIPRIDLNLTQCFPEKEACLFDVVTDPCELENLAKDLPQHIERVTKWSESHASEAVDPVMTLDSLDHFDPRADPELHGGNWAPWLSEE